MSPSFAITADTMPQSEKSTSSSTQRFDANYYRRFYVDAATRATTKVEIATRGALIAAVVKQFDIPVRQVLDAGCGLGWYEKPLIKAFPQAKYVGTEVSEYLCRTKGWVHGSIVDLKFRREFDLVICSDVIQYLDARNAERAIENLGKWCRGALYLHVPTRRDWAQNVDHSGTDANVWLRSASWYRNLLRKHFVHAGCGVHIKNDVPFAQWELEQPWR